MKRYAWLFLVAIFALSCGRHASNKFSDARLVEIYNLRDRRSTDSLLQFLNDANPVYRQAAALAFASVQDSAASLALGAHLLEDPDDQVRINAAFSLGQTKGFQALNALLPAMQDNSREVVREVLEALGKAIGRRDQALLVSFRSTDTLLQEGQAWAFYRLALRKQTDSLVTGRVNEYLQPPHSFQTRLAAAHYFGRSNHIPGAGFQNNLVMAARNDARPEVRMAAVSGLKNIPVGELAPVLKQLLEHESDERVRINAVRVCQNFPLSDTSPILELGLADSVANVVIATSEVIRQRAEGKLPASFGAWLSKPIDGRSKSNLLAAFLKTKPSDSLWSTMSGLYSEAPVYFRAALLSALGETREPWNRKAFEFLRVEVLKKDNSKVLRTSAAMALTSMNRHNAKGISTAEFLSVYREAVAVSDEAVTGIVADVLVDESLGFKKEVKDLSFLHEAKAALSLPRDIESLQPIEIAIAYLEGREKPAPLRNQFNHPIHWGEVKGIDVDQCVEVKTSQGTILLELAVEDSPGSVANFVNLVQKKYYDGKFFHRVVPNFVVQTGCNRGDGYGSEDYSIRSEFSRSRYITGSVGMASAGKDTEGTQWFITHSPTPHLDGGYTIVGHVIKGMEVINRIQVGDQVVSVNLIENK